MNTQKKIRAFGAYALIIALLVMGTFAWIFGGQEKRNQAEGEKKVRTHDVTLVNNYTPPDSWEEGEVLPLDTYVKYPDLKSKELDPGSIAVRLQLQEHLEFIDHNIYSEFSCVTYSNLAEVNAAINGGWDPEAKLGGFVKFISVGQKSGMYFYDNSYYGKNRRITDYEPIELYSVSDDPNKPKPIYVKAPDILGANLDTKMQIDGQHGKKIVTGFNKDAKGFKDFITGVPNNNNAGIEDKGRTYTKYYKKPFVAGSGALGYSEFLNSQKFREHIDIEFSDSVMTKEEYEALSSEQQAEKYVWVYAVDDNGIPWLYWNHALWPGGRTASVINSLTLVESFNDDFLYLQEIKLNATSTDYDYVNDVENITGVFGNWMIPVVDPETYTDEEFRFPEEYDGTMYPVYKDSGKPIPNRRGIVVGDTYYKKDASARAAFEKVARRSDSRVLLTNGKEVRDKSGNIVHFEVDYRVLATSDTPPREPYINLGNGYTLEIDTTDDIVGKSGRKERAPRLGIVDNFVQYNDGLEVSDFKFRLVDYGIKKIETGGYSEYVATLLMINEDATRTNDKFSNSTIDENTDIFESLIYTTPVNFGNAPVIGRLSNVTSMNFHDQHDINFSRASTGGAVHFWVPSVYEVKKWGNPTVNVPEYWTRSSSSELGKVYVATPTNGKFEEKTATDASNYRGAMYAELR